MATPLKKKSFILLGVLGVTLSLALTGCTNNVNDEDNDTCVGDCLDDNLNLDNEEETTINENEDLTVPEQSSITQIYLKRALTNLVVGQTLDLTNYIGILPGTNDDQDAITFSSSIFISEDELDCASLVSNTLSLYRVGSFRLAISANGQHRVFSLEVGSSTLLNTLTSFLGEIEDNFTAEFITTDSLGAEVIDSRTYRTANYIYNDSVGYGFLLSNKDYNTYEFDLSDVDSEDVDVITPPMGDSSTYTSTFFKISDFADPTYWRYTTSFSSEAQYSSYNYVLDVSSTYVSNFCTSLFLSNYIIQGTTYVYPYRIYARVTSNEVRFIPVYASSDESTIIYTYPLRFVDVGTTKIDVLEEYNETIGAPEKVDTTEIITNFKYLSSILNYTWDTDLTVYDEEGVRLGTGTSLYTSFFARFGRPLCEKKATPNAYWSAAYTSYNGGLVPGGLLSYDGVTYKYNNYLDEEIYSNYVVDGEYEVYTTSGTLVSYPNWYSYSTMTDHVPDSCFDYGDIFNCYPSINEDGDYVISGSSDEGLGFIQDFLAFSVQSYAARYGILTSALNSMKSTEMTIHFEYDESGTLTEVNVTTLLTYDHTLETSLTEDYTMEYVSIIYDIGTTDLSDIEDYLVGNYLTNQ